MQKYDNHDTVSDNNVQCALGINKKTGRLQWCPGYCNLSRILILVPATMIPICLLFLLFTHVGVSKTSNDGDFSNQRRSIRTRNIETTPLCRIVRSGLSETILSEEREILKDVRTSFIPTDLIVIPPNCKDSDDPEYNSADNDENDINDEIPNISEYLKRRRRSHSKDENDTSEMVIDLFHSDYDFDDIGDNDNDDDPPWKLSDECDPPSNTAELEEGEHKKTWNCDRSSSMAFHAFWKGEGSPQKIRSTQAEMMKQYMDTSVHPCDDFYQYACGNWEKLNPIPKDKAAYDTFEMLRESLDSVLRDLLNSKQPLVSRKQESKPCENSSRISKQLSIDCNKSEEQTPSRLRRNIFRRRRDLKQIIEKFQSKRLRRELREIIENAEVKAQNLYKSCMNYSVIEKRGVEPLLSLLKTIGGWPVLNLNSWDESKFDWLESTAKLRLYNNDVLIAEWVGPDIKNSEENIIQFDQTSLGLPTRDYFLQDTNIQYLNAYEAYMSTTIKLLGTNETIANQAAKEIVKFEKELAEITSSPEERTNVSILYNKMDLESLHHLIPQIDWTRYLTIVLERPVYSNESVVMFATKYMQNLVNLLSQTDKRTVANYVIWRFVRHRINNLDDRFQDAKQKFYNVLFGREQSPPRWKSCVNQVRFL